MGTDDGQNISLMLVGDTVEHNTQGRPLPMGQQGQSDPLAHPLKKIFKKKKKKKNNEALQYCDSNEFIKLAVGTSRVLMSKAVTNNIYSNKHKV
jgi:hypothetical protein